MTDLLQEGTDLFQIGNRMGWVLFSTLLIVALPALLSLWRPARTSVRMHGRFSGSAARRRFRAAQSPVRRGPFALQDRYRGPEHEHDEHERDEKERAA